MKSIHKAWHACDPSASEPDERPASWAGSFRLRDHSLFMPGGGLARMGGGPRQIQDSQKGVINKSAHKERGGGGTWFSIFVLFSNKYF